MQGTLVVKPLALASLAAGADGYSGSASGSGRALCDGKRVNSGTFCRADGLCGKISPCFREEIVAWRRQVMVEMVYLGPQVRFARKRLKLLSSDRLGLKISPALLLDCAEA